MEQNNEEELLRRYLLGDVIQQEQDEIQDRLFTDSAFFNLLLMIENELADDYLFNNLAPSEQIQFEQYFLRSPERRHKLRIAQELMHQASSERVVRQPPPKRTASWRAFFINPRFAYSALMIIVAAVIIWLLRDRQIMKHKIAELRASQDTQQKQEESPQSIEEKLAERRANDDRKKEQLPEGIQVLKQSAEQQAKDKKSASDPEKTQPEDDSTLISKLEPQDLWPGQIRGAGETDHVRIQRGAKQVLLKLHLEAHKDPIYRIDIRNSRDQRIRVPEDVKPEQTNEGSFLQIKVPASIFKRGDYIITAQGIKTGGGLGSINTYQFRVEVE